MSTAVLVENKVNASAVAVPSLFAERMTAGYGPGTDILRDCSLAVNNGEIAVIFGPDGAGKSTALKALFGMIDLRSGTVSFRGEPITHLAPSARAAKGIALVPQVSNVFASMSVEQNLEMGAFLRRGNVTATLTSVYNLFPALLKKRTGPAGALPDGVRRQLAIARALMTAPSVLLLDEPTTGLDPDTQAEVFACITDIARTGVAVVMVERHTRAALDIADKGYVLVEGDSTPGSTVASLSAVPDWRKP